MASQNKLNINTMREQEKERTDEKSIRSCPKIPVTIVSHTRQDVVVLVNVGINGRCYNLYPGKCICYRVYP